MNKKKEPKEQQTINLNDEESLDDFVENESINDINIDADRQHTLELEEIIQDNTNNEVIINENVECDEISDKNFDNEQDLSKFDSSFSANMTNDVKNNHDEISLNSSSEQIYNQIQNNKNKESVSNKNIDNNKIVFELDNEFSIKNVEDENDENIINNETENMSEQNENLNTIDKLGAR